MKRKIFQKFSSGLDYLTVRANTQSDFWEVLKSPKEMFDQVKIPGLPFFCKYDKKMTEFDILRLKDEIGNTMGQVKILTNPTGGRTNVFNEIELQGSFFMTYPQYLQQILNVFGIDIEKTKIAARIDWRVDVLSSSTNIHNYFRESGKEIMVRQKWDVKTWGKIKTDRIEAVYYDKKLDIRKTDEKISCVDIFGNRPYDEYLNCKNDITRIEYRKNSRALRETERTLMEELVWVKNDALKYINNIGIYIDDDIDLPRTYKKQEEMRIKKEEEIINRAISNIEAYAHRLDMHGANEKLVRSLYSRYGTELIGKLQDMHFELYRDASEMFAEKKIIHDIGHL